MDNGLRLQYLEAMGIPVWLPRFSAPESQDSEAADVIEQEPESLSLAEEFDSWPAADYIIEAADDEVADIEAFELEQADIEPAAYGRDSLELAELEQKKPLVYDWDSLESTVASCTKCELCKTRTQTVFGAGNKNADWMFIGEAPGQSEDEQGKPFVGTAGLLLTEMIRALGFSRDEVFITNILKCRPPNNRDPHVEEVENCREFIEAQINLIKPKIIVAVGRIAAQSLLNTHEPIGKLRGKVHTVNNTPVVVVYHPAYLLRTLLEKRKAWQDLQFAMQTFKHQ